MNEITIFLTLRSVRSIWRKRCIVFRHYR